MTDIRYRYLDDDDAALLANAHSNLRGSHGSIIGPDDFCPTCDKTGSYTWKGVSVRCDCELQLALYKHYLAAGIGTTYQRLNWEDFDGPDEILSGVLAYLDNARRYVARGIGLFFTGDVGTGKTMIATLALKELIKQNYRCYATTFAQTIEAFTAGWYSGEEKERFRRRFIHSEVLLLDDVGKELRGTKLALSETTFDNILRERVQNARPTIITTNLTLDELGDGFGHAVLSLLHEKSVEAVFTGTDYRKKANTREMAEIAADETRPIT